MASLRRAETHELQPDERQGLRRLLDIAFEGDFAETDWTNSLGGTHIVVEQDGLFLSHASVVGRTLRLGNRAMRTGYVEAVATRPDHQRRGHAKQVLQEVAVVIGERYELGGLSTGVPLLYERLGWERWKGPTFASTPAGIVRTAEEDEGIMILCTPGAGRLDLDEPITCDWREGDVW